MVTVWPSRNRIEISGQVVPAGVLKRYARSCPLGALLADTSWPPSLTAAALYFSGNARIMAHVCGNSLWSTWAECPDNAAAEHVIDLFGVFLMHSGDPPSNLIRSQRLNMPQYPAHLREHFDQLYSFFVRMSLGDPYEALQQRYIHVVFSGADQ